MAISGPGRVGQAANNLKSYDFLFRMTATSGGIGFARAEAGRSMASIFDGLGLSDDQLKECQKRHIEHEKEQDAKIEALMNMSTCKGDMHWAS